MNRISSNFTLFWKLFIPSFFTAILCLFGLVLLFANNDNFDIFYTATAKWIYAVFTVLIIFLMYKKLFSFHRVEFDEEYFYISNYFKTIRLPHEGVDYITSSRIFGLTGKVHLKQKGRFGKTIRFIPYTLGMSDLGKTSINVK